MRDYLGNLILQQEAMERKLNKNVVKKICFFEKIDSSGADTGKN